MSQPPTGARPRVEPVDVLRGVIMVIMALDHTRDYFGDYNVNPTALASTTPALFFTRWITHFCAPVFFLLTGTGAFLSLQKKTRPELSRYLWTRGLWLLVLEFTVGRFGLQFNLDYKVTVLLVLWALGWSMIVLAGLIHFSTRAVVTFGVLLIALHNLLDGIRADTFGAFAPLWNFLHAPGLLYQGQDRFLLLAYPIIPWIGVTAVGYGLGALYLWDAERRRACLLRLGLGLSAAFIVLRLLNIYGDPVPWSSQPTGLYTLLSFLNTSKYPPSLLFLLMTLGPALCMLALVDARTPAWLRPANVFGRVPLFYYLVHFPLIHLLAVFASAFRYGEVAGLFQSPTLDRFPFTQPPGWGQGLPVVYAMWLLVVLSMYPLSRWWAGLKQQRKDAWLSYL
jgi:uncharacterized membrane protein